MTLTSFLQRRFSPLLLLTAALVAIAVLFIHDTPTHAQVPDPSVILVSNTGQSEFGDYSTRNQVIAQGFTTGTVTEGYTLTGLVASLHETSTTAQWATVRAELWSATTSGAPNAKIADLTRPSDPATGLVTFTPPTGTQLTASTTYFFVLYTVGQHELGWHATNSDGEDSGAATGWSIANEFRGQARDTPGSGNWSNPAHSVRMRVRGHGPLATNPNLSALTARTSTSETGTYSSLALSPAFDAQTTAYTATVPDSVTHLRLTATVEDTGKATVQLGPVGLLDPVDSGVEGPPMALSAGSNVFNVIVSAEDPTVVKTYAITITVTPSVSLTASPSTVDEGSSVTVTATLSSALSGDVTIPITITDGTAESGDHGTLAGITISGGATSGTGTIGTNQDNDDDHETFTVSLGTPLPPGVVAGSPTSALVTIRDDEAAPPPAYASEVVWSGTLTVTEIRNMKDDTLYARGCNESNPCQVHLSSGNRFTHEGVTYTIVSLALAPPIPDRRSFTNGDIVRGHPQRLWLSLDKAIPEGWALVVDGSAWYHIGDVDRISTSKNVVWYNPGLSWAADDKVELSLVAPADGVPTVSLSASPNPVLEGDPVTLTATLSAALSADVTVPLASDRYQADAGDYATPASITIPAGATSATATITTAEDTEEIHDDEVFIVSLGPNLPTAVLSGDPRSLRVQVIDDEDLPTATVWVVSEDTNALGHRSGDVVEGRNLLVRVALSRRMSIPVAVPVTCTPGTAEAGDYSCPSEVALRLGNRIDFGTITTSHDDDGTTYDAIYETFTVSLGTLPDWLRAGGRSSVGTTILDDDRSAEVTLSASPNPVEEGSSVTFTATLTAALERDVIIPLDVGAITAEEDDFGPMLPRADTFVGGDDITIPAGSTTGTGTIATYADDDSDPESFVVSPSSVFLLPRDVAWADPRWVSITISESSGQQTGNSPSCDNCGGEGETGAVSEYADLIAQMYEWREDPQWRHQKSHTDRWDRALLAFGEEVDDKSLTPMTASEAQGYADTDWGERWVPVAKAMWELENQPPTVASALADLTGLAMETTRDISLAGVFTDPDGDDLTITAASSDEAIATVTVAADGSALTVTGVSEGTATVTVTAQDPHGEQATDAFQVEVVGKYAALIAQMYEWREDPQWRHRKSHTDRWDRALLAFGETVADTTLTPMTAAEAQEVADEGLERWVPVAAALWEIEGEQPNSAPTVSSAIADITIVNESGTQSVSLSGVFDDADGDSLTITAASSDDAKATVSVSSDYSSLTVSAQARGAATVTVTANDGNGGSVSDSFTVTVKAAPVLASALADVTGLEVEEEQLVSLSGAFSDADGDALTLTAASSNQTIATATVNSGVLSVTGAAEGTATVTVTARDSDGNTASDAFDVSVVAPPPQQQQADPPNQPPTVSSAIADATIVNESGTHQVSLSGVFDDADGDSLTITAASSDDTKATVSVSSDYSSLTVSAQARGAATVTVTASDGNGGSVSDSFTVTVKAAPVLASAIGDVSGLEAGATQEVNLSGVFSDADGDALTLSAASSDEAVSTIAVGGDGSALTLSGVAGGTATVTVTARDSDGNTVSDTFDVSVVEPEQQSSGGAPTVVSPLDDLSLEPEGWRKIDLSGVFSDPDDDELTLTVESTDSGVARTWKSGWTLWIINSTGAGTATITVTAEDPDGNTVSDAFEVTVTPAE